MRDLSEFEKGDRIVRLLGELRQFQAVPHGLTTKELGERMGISQRPAPQYRATRATCPPLRLSPKPTLSSDCPQCTLPHVRVPTPESPAPLI